MENINNSLIINYKETKNILKDSKQIIELSKEVALRSVNVVLVQRNWLLGKRIATEELKGNRKANYGKEIIDNLSKELTKEYDKGFDRSNLYHYYTFYKLFPKIVDTVCRQSQRLLS